MNCIGPATPEDFELLAYADGEASPAVSAHLSACAYCRLRSVELRREESAWQNALHRAGCPPPLELGEHHLDLLDADRSARVVEHLRYCRACESEVALLAGFMRPTRSRQAYEAAAAAGGRLRTIVARLVDAESGAAAGAWMPAPRAVRDVRGPYSASNLSGPLAYEAEDFLVSIEFWPEGPGRQTRQLVGFVAGPEDFAGAMVELFNGGSGPQVAALDESGSFVVEGVMPGPHWLLVRLPAAGVQVQITDLTVN